MIHMVFYSQDFAGIPSVRAVVDENCKDINCTYVFFEYPMDVIDYVYQNSPAKCVVFYNTTKLDEALEVSERIHSVNPRYRFALICPEHGEDVEQLFKKGISYYIESPEITESLQSCSEHFKAFFDDQSGKNIILKTKKGNDVLKLGDIKYVMSDKRKIVIYLNNNEMSYYYKLDEVEDMLGKSFLRCHQSYIVNMMKIKQFVEDGLLLDDDEFIPVSRKRYFAAKREYLSYVTGNKLEKM